jgi:hypothetical protein
VGDELEGGRDMYGLITERSDAGLRASRKEDKSEESEE